MKYYIIAGEASGDLHGSNLMRALFEQDPEADIRFWGGDAMADVGGTMVRHIRDLAIMGFIEVVRHLNTVLGNLNFCKRDIQQFAPDAIIYIDYPGFNLKIARWAHRHGYRNFHYISPQLWAWKKGRIKSMRRNLDALFYILPFEQQFYAVNNMPQAHFVGHPLLDAVPEQTLHNEDETKQIALLPGSRRQEIAKVMPDMLRLARRHPDLHFVVAGMTLLGEEFYRRQMAEFQDLQNVEIRLDSTYDILAKVYAAVVCSGTATLETALFDVPQVVCYKANGLSIAIARAFVGKRVRYISLVNLIADKDVVVELIQNDCNDLRLEHEFKQITIDQANRARMKAGYAEVHSLLGGRGASQRTAQLIINNLK